MPTYEYECTSCGQHIEAFQRISEEPLTMCGACGGVLRKVFHPAGIVFKGSGFYATDSRSGSKPDAQKDGRKEAKTETKKSDAGSTTTSAPPSSSDSGSTPSAPKGPASS